MPRTSFFRFASIFFSLLFTISLLGQEPETAQEPEADTSVQRVNGLRIFIDCARCDMNYIREEVPYVNYVRDVKEAQLYILETRERTGSGGNKYTYAFVGQKEFDGLSDTLVYSSRPDDTRDYQRIWRTQMAQGKSWQKLNWQDPFLLEQQLNDEQRMVRDTARQYAQDKLQPRVQEAYRVTESKAHLSNRALRTPRAAAIAGILFAVLLGTGHVLIQLSVPADLLDTSDWLDDQAKTVALALSLVPFAGISFLWFMGVVRDRMGHLEDQFFSTLFFGSGYLYLGMTFASAAIAGGILTFYALDPGMLIGSESYALSRIIINRINTVYAMRMAGMFMYVLGTIWVRTQVMPRWLALVTYGPGSAD